MPGKAKVRLRRAQPGQPTKGLSIDLTERTPDPPHPAARPARGMAAGIAGGEDGNYHLDAPAALAPTEEVASLSNVVKTHPHLPHVTLNSDGKTHPLENTLALVTLVTGVAAFACGFVVALHLPAVVLGLVALFLGMYVQLISATREERILIMTGVVAAFVGAGLGFAHGGFSV